MLHNRRRDSVLYLIVKREPWGLTWLGWLALVLAVVTAGFVSLLNLHGFLACNDPVRGQVLVVEGWIPDYAIPGAISEFEKNGCRQLVCVGGPIEKGSYLSGFKSYERLTEARLVALGVDEKGLFMGCGTFLSFEVS
jgi:hypothetical protein